MPYKNIEDQRAYHARRYASDPEFVREMSERQRAWYQANRERAVAVRKAWRDSNREKVKAMFVSWTQENPDLYRAHKNAMEAKRDAAKLCATPKWLTKAHLKEMRGIYIKARELTVRTKEPHHVDHIVPLAGKTVRGLHVPWNLRVVKGTENVRKSNLLIDHLVAA